MYSREKALYGTLIAEGGITVMVSATISPILF